MNYITVYKKDILEDGLFRISAIDETKGNYKYNYLYHIMLILRLESKPVSTIDNSFAYDFAFNFGG